MAGGSGAFIMAGTSITCPKCRHSFELTEAMSAPIEARLRAQFEADAAQKAEDLAAKEKELAAKAAALAKAQDSVEEAVATRLIAERARVERDARAKAAEAVSLELQAAKEEAAEQRAKAEAATKREIELARRERDLTEKQSALELDVQKAIESERAALVEKARKEALTQQEAALKALREENVAKGQALAEAQRAELALRQERSKLEQEKQALELEVARQLDAERAKIRADALAQADEQHRLTLAEKDQTMAELRAQLDAARRKADQGSQQAQGEVLEVELERLLKEAFPTDVFEPVPKGVHGGDVVHRVRNELGQLCGTILWESKRTKIWQDAFLSKNRDDGRIAKADACAIMSVTLPKAITTFGQVDGVWVTNRACVVGVAAALRLGILQVAEAKRAMQGQAGKMELVYQYLTGSQFRQRVEAIVEAFSTMQKDLDAEKRAMERLWAKREKQIERAALNAMGMHGDLSGIVGNALPEIEGMNLSLPGSVDL